MSVRIVHVVRALIINSDNVFPILLRNAGAYGCLQLPGGVVEGIANEMNPSEGCLYGELSREVREELGLDINITAWERIHQAVPSKIFKPGDLGYRSDLGTDDIQYYMHYFVTRVGDVNYEYTEEERCKFLLMIRADFGKIVRLTQLLEKMETIIDDNSKQEIVIKLDTGLVEILRLYALHQSQKVAMATMSGYSIG